MQFSCQHLRLQTVVSNRTVKATDAMGRSTRALYHITGLQTGSLSARLHSDSQEIIPKERFLQKRGLPVHASHSLSLSLLLSKCDASEIAWNTNGYEHWQPVCVWSLFDQLWSLNILKLLSKCGLRTKITVSIPLRCRTKMKKSGTGKLYTSIWLPQQPQSSTWVGKCTVWTVLEDESHPKCLHNFANNNLNELAMRTPSASLNSIMNHEVSLCRKMFNNYNAVRHLSYMLYVVFCSNLINTVATSAAAWLTIGMWPDTREGSHCARNDLCIWRSICESLHV